MPKIKKARQECRATFQWFWLIMKKNIVKYTTDPTRYVRCHQLCVYLIVRIIVMTKLVEKLNIQIFFVKKARNCLDD